MGLQDLPPEILFQICELFCEHCQGQWHNREPPWQWHNTNREPPPEWWKFSPPRRTLYMLSLVCNSIRPFAQRVLHHHFGVQYLDTNDDALALICRTIYNKPELGKDLRWAGLSVRFRAWRTKGIVQGWLPEAVDKFSRYLCNGAQELRYKRLLAPIILLQAPNLELLQGDGFEVLNLDAAIQGGALPSNLKSLRLVKSKSTRSMDLSWDGDGGFIETFKSLKSLAIYRPLASGVDERLSLQSLHTLRLYEFYMPREDFENLISHIPRLEEFAISRAKIPKERAPATVPEILQVLAQRNDTLRRLELDMSCTHDNVGLLKTLTKLEELKIMVGSFRRAEYGTWIDKQALIGIMPPSLRKLSIEPHSEYSFEMARDALMTYISSTYREHPHDQRLQMVHFNMSHMIYRERLWPYHQRDIIEQGYQEWRKNGTLVFDI